jgi:hypothetical protein
LQAACKLLVSVNGQDRGRLKTVRITRQISGIPYADEEWLLANCVTLQIKLTAGLDHPEERA